MFNRRERIAPQVSSEASMRVVSASDSEGCSAGVVALVAPEVPGVLRPPPMWSGDGVAIGVVVYVDACRLLNAHPGSCDGSSRMSPGLVLVERIINSALVGLAWL